MSEFIKELRETTQNAIRRGQEERLAEQLRAERARLDKERREQTEANNILSSVPETCRSAAQAGQGYATITRLQAGKDYLITDNNWGQITVSNLQGMAHKLYHGLRQLGLSVELEYCHDGMGMDSWFDLNVRW